MHENSKMSIVQMHYENTCSPSNWQALCSMASAKFKEEVHGALQKGVPITGAIVAFAHIFFIGADLGFAHADFGFMLRYRLLAAAFFAALAGMSLTAWGRKRWQTRNLGMLIIGLCGISVSNLTAMTGGSVSPYWTMIMLTFFGGTLMLRLSPFEAGIAYGTAILYHFANMLFYMHDNPQSPEFISSLFGILLAFIVSLIGNWYIRNLQLSEFRTRQSLAEANEKLKASVSELQYKRQQEQLRYLQKRLDLANDLHDAVGAKLSQIRVLAERTRIDDTRHLRTLSETVLENVRNFAHILKGEEEVADLKQQLSRLADSLRALGRYKVELRLPPHPIQLSDLALLNVDRILSEWTANVIRHAHATSLELIARQTSSHLLVFFVQDNTPFSWRGRAGRGGLKSIALRAQNIGAAVAVRPFQGGAIFVLRIPNRDRESSP